jgi:ribosomal protein L11 methyltransferase
LAEIDMKPQRLTKVSVCIAPEAEEAVAELLSELFGRPASVYTEVETRRTTASVYLSKRSDWSPGKRTALRAGLRRLEKFGLDTGTGRIARTKLRREDWAESWKRHFQPIEIGRTLLIKPSWSKRQPRDAQAAVVLDPGLSFGTGQHPTTRFCLEQLVSARKVDSSQSFLDVGTGSGILAIAAAKLCYEPVEAFDCDAEAVRIARLNAKQNRVVSKLEVTRQDFTKLPGKASRRFDVVCANLTGDLLLTARGRLLARLKRSGRLVLAGVLKQEFPVIRRAYERAGLKLVAWRTKSEWQSGVFFWK